MKTITDISTYCFVSFLLNRESDIAQGIEDFDDLRYVFIEFIGREPKGD